ncbi:hypothetical protein [uncultured Halomonas sp.]|uniref:hypothetical protein n=1 Tax=uncultured Halomonas sp. TaxID=173971 RepID=UPI0026161E56|nr:hypothetical protein [uncultured Halomonas sp.]
MTRLNLATMPQLSGDQTLQSLVETFNARVIQAETEEEYIGNWTSTVRVGESEYIKLPTVRLVFACGKAELERARATLFASHLLQQGRETARELWKQAAPWEGSEFMAWVKADIEWKRANGEAA